MILNAYLWRNIFFNAEWLCVDAVARVWIVGGKRDGAGRAHAKAIDAPTMPRDDEVGGLCVDCAGACVASNALTPGGGGRAGRATLNYYDIEY